MKKLILLLLYFLPIVTFGQATQNITPFFGADFPYHNPTDSIYVSWAYKPDGMSAFYTSWYTRNNFLQKKDTVKYQSYTQKVIDSILFGLKPFIELTTFQNGITDNAKPTSPNNVTRLRDVDSLLQAQALLTNGYGVTALDYNGIAAAAVVIDTTAIKTKTSALADYNILKSAIVGLSSTYASINNPALTGYLTTGGFNRGTNADSIGHGTMGGQTFVSQNTIQGATQILNTGGSTFIINTNNDPLAGDFHHLHENNVLTIWRHSSTPTQPSAINYLDSAGYERGADGWAQVPFVGYTSTSYSQAYGNAMFFTASYPYKYGGYGASSNYPQPSRLTLVQEGKSITSGTNNVAARLSFESNWDIRFWTDLRDSILTFKGSTGIGTFYKPVTFNQQVTFGTSLSNVNFTGATGFMNSQAAFNTTATNPMIYGTGSAGLAYPFLTSGNLVLQSRPSGASRDIDFVTGTTPAVYMAVTGTGHVLINTTSDNGSDPLQVSGNISSSSHNTSGAMTVGTFMNFTNGQTAYDASHTNPIIYSTTSTGSTYPFLEAGNMVISPRISGSARDIIFATGSTPTPTMEILRSGAVSLPNVTASSLLGTDANHNLGAITSLPNGTTAITQSTVDNSTKIATTAFVNTAIGTTVRGYGQVTLSSGQATVAISGLTASSRAHISFVSIGGSVSTTWQYAGVCTSGTLTVTALTNTGSTNTSDTSVLTYYVEN